MSKTLVIGDLHEPATHPGYLKFCKDVQKKYDTKKTIFIGDIVDWHGISFHDKEPHCPGPMMEYTQAKAQIKKWHRAFPNALICIGNHDCRPQRLAKTKGIPEEFLRSYNDLWGTPTWKWDFHYIFDDVYYTHGTRSGGIHPAWNKSGKMLMSVVMGHCHARAGLKWRANPLKRIFSMDVGCGIDNDAFQFIYGKDYDDKPFLSCGVVLDGGPKHIEMKMAKGERYHKSRFTNG
jgi:hypothetical protein